MRNVGRNVFLLQAIVLACVFGNNAQSVNFGIREVAPRPCEFNNTVLERANRDAGEHSIIVLLGRSGVKDDKSDVLKHRLHTARAYLVEYSNLRKRETVVVGEAYEVGKLPYGGVEVYVNGRFYDILTSLPNLDLAVGTCSGEESNDLRSRERLHILFPWHYPKPSR